MLKTTLPGRICTCPSTAFSLDLLEGNCGDTHHHNASLCASPAELSLAQAVPPCKNKTGTFFRLHKWPPILSSGETSPSPTPFPRQAEGIRDNGGIQWQAET